MRDHPNLTTDQIAALKLLEKLLDEIPPDKRGPGWPNDVTAEEFSYDIIVGAWYEQNDKIMAAKKRHQNKVLGFEKCLQLAFNFKEDFTNKEIKDFIDKFLASKWTQLTRAIFCVEFWTMCDDGESYKWNPHIHVWVPHCPPAALRQAATRRFKNERVNVWVGPGHKNLKDYVLGKKRDDKQACVQQDVEHRRSCGFKEVYEF